jgi:hypothetical protein
MQLWAAPFLALHLAHPPYEPPRAGGPVIGLLDEATEGLSGSSRPNGFGDGGIEGDYGHPSEPGATEGCRVVAVRA